jgi:Protein of unknown function (DUF2490)
LTRLLRIHHREKMIYSRIVALLGLLWVIAAAGHAAKWDVQYWQYLEWKNWESGHCKLYTNGLTRLTNDLSRFTYYRISECFAYKALEDLVLEVHYSYINSKSPGARSFLNTSRLELEANPSHTFENGISFHWRNRLELLKIEHNPSIQFVMRERFGIKVPIKNGGKLVAWKMGDEVFYNLSIKKLNENRLVPFGIILALSRHTSLDLFTMIRHQFTSNKWYRSFIFASQLSF